LMPNSGRSRILSGLITIVLGQIVAAHLLKRAVQGLKPPTGLKPQVPTPTMPRPVPLLERYKLLQVLSAAAAIATLITVIFAFQAAKDAERQLSLTRVQLEPDFRVTPHERVITDRKRNSSAYIASYDRLIFTVNGSAQDVTIFEKSYFAYLLASHPSTLRVHLVSWWNQQNPEVGELARWTANPSVLDGLVGDTSFSRFNTISIFYIGYLNALGERRTKAFVVDSTFNVPSTIVPMDPGNAVRCSTALSGESLTPRINPRVSFPRKPLAASDLLNLKFGHYVQRSSLMSCSMRF
jgi:hypothetical protein